MDLRPNIQDLLRQTTPGPTRALDHAALQRHGRRHRRIRHISAVAGAAALLGTVILGGGRLPQIELIEMLEELPST